MSTKKKKAAAPKKKAAAPKKKAAAPKKKAAASKKKATAPKKKAASAKKSTKATKKASPKLSGEVRFLKLQKEAYLLAEKDGFSKEAIVYWVQAERSI